MFQKQCSHPSESEKMQDPQNNFFLRSATEQFRYERKMRAEDMRATTENPMLREEHELGKVAKTVLDRNREELVKEKQRQQIRANHEELRLFSRQLKDSNMAYNIDQHGFTMVDKLKQKLQRKREEEVIEQGERQRVEHEVNQRKTKEFNKKMEQRSVLLDQIAEKKQRRQDEQQQKMKDREEMQKLVRRYEQEDELQRKAVLAEKERNKKEMKDFLESEKRAREMLRLANSEQGDGYSQIQQARQEQQRKQEEEKRKRQKAKEQLSMEIGTRIWKENEDKRLREELVQSLLVEESKEKADERRLMEQQKLMHEREEARRDIQHYKDEKLFKKLSSIIEEKRTFLDEQKRLLEEADRKEQEKKERVRRENQEYQKSLIKMIDDKHFEQLKQAAEALQASKDLKEHKRKVDAVIKDERQRMLREKRPDVLRCLPLSFVHKDDRALVSELVKE